ncbi:Hsp20/alpha crystallin family protein [Roseovarius sp. SCSIO 43702]|uniref:Hsp20/alpha crystallin family protein n=1 Tax=Roseovarius sp. SCSIO 43702 TaxID=2823043 RepID=UPI001C734857|nr:Hsp20/alpha crystallin family protein [Roseovarius sp. SCSIO 43702]QYX55693.1 Hsp20/alpha crystallin family protein [Roseovarius sp. SCSIO 43702]
MAFSDLIPWGRDRNQVSDRRRDDDNPMVSLQRDLNRVFEDFWGRFDSPFGSMSTGPRTDISETDDAMQVAVDLPGLDEKDIEVNVTDDMLTIRGEREEKSDKDGFTSQSRRSFHRMIPVPPGVDADKAEAEFKRGVLTVTLPKTEEAKARVKRIDVKSG